MAVMDIKRPKPVTTTPSAPVNIGLHKKLILLITRRNAAIAVAAILVLSIGFISLRHLQAKTQPNSSPQQATAEIKDVTTKVGRLVLLPSGGQVPTVAIIKNAATLKNQSFFANAQDGDYVLVYSQAKKAILYRPSINRVIVYSNTN
jgi:hypothetical protein